MMTMAMMDIGVYNRSRGQKAIWTLCLFAGDKLNCAHSCMHARSGAHTSEGWTPVMTRMSLGVC